MSEIFKLENESDDEFIARIYKSKLELNLNNKEIHEKLNKAMGTSYGESTLRCKAQSINIGIDIGIEKALSNNGESELIKELEEKKIELEEKTSVFIKEKIKFQDQRREFNKNYRPEARFENIVNVMVDSIEELNKVKPLIPNLNIIENDGITEAVLLASDWHLYGKWDNKFGRYNCDIAKRRIEELLERVIKHCKLHKVSTLNLELLGDNISGRIHSSAQVESEEDVMTQAMGLCEVMGNVVEILANKIENIKVYSVIGNHSRLDQNKKNNQKGESLERLVPWFLKTRLKDFKNVEICTNANIDDTIVVFDVLNTKLVGVHGDLDSPATVVNNMIKLLKIIPDEVNCGHLHHHFEKEEFEIEVVQNGSMGGTDTYASDIRRSGRPMQKLRIYNEEGLLCSYKIKLRI